MTRKKNKQSKPELPASRGGDLPVDDRLLSGQVLVAAMQTSPHRDIDIEPERLPMPVRDVVL